MKNECTKPDKTVDTHQENSPASEEHALKPRKSWWQRFRSSTAYTQANIVCTILIMIATFAYATIAYFQWRAMNGQVAQMQGSSQQMDRLIGIYQQQLQQMTKQATSTGNLADATNNALIVSEGAYLSLEGVHVDSDRKAAMVSAINIGHLPADGFLTIFEMTVKRGEQTKYTVGFPMGEPIEGHWSEPHFTGATYTSPPLAWTPLPDFVQADYSQGKTAVIISGNFSYSDGFPGTPKRAATFCYINFFDMQIHQQNAVSCDEGRMTARIKRYIKFPGTRVDQP